MESKRTARQSGFELVRIIAMFLIVANHLANHGIFKVTSEDIYALWPEMSPFNQAAGALISCGGRIGVAVFFMLTGYFMVERDKLSPKSAVNFLWRVHFFAAAMFAIVVILRAATGLGADINMSLAARKSFCTPLTIWWFALAYFVLLFTQAANLKGNILAAAICAPTSAEATVRRLYSGETATLQT